MFGFMIIDVWFLHTFSPEKFSKEGLPDTMVLLSNLVHLAYDVKQHLEFCEVEILCRLVECLTTAITQQQKGINLEDAVQHRKSSNEMFSHFEKLLKHVETFVKDKLLQPYARKAIAFPDKELDVSVHFSIDLWYFYYCIYI